MNDELRAYENLGNAIIEQAHRDYVDALVMEHKALIYLRRAAAKKKEATDFFGTKWYYAITTVDPGTIVEVSRKQADYLIWKNWHGCDTCRRTEAECCHKADWYTNWQEFDKGNRDCPVEDEQRRAADRRKRENKTQKADAKQD